MPRSSTLGDRRSELRRVAIPSAFALSEGIEEGGPEARVADLCERVVCCTAIAVLVSLSLTVFGIVLLRSPS